MLTLIKSQNVADLKQLVGQDFNPKKMHLQQELRLQPIDITPKFLDHSRWHTIDRTQTFELFDRARYLRDYPSKKTTALDEFIDSKVHKESYFERRDREKREEEERVSRSYVDDAIDPSSFSRPPTSTYVPPQPFDDDDE